MIVIIGSTDEPYQIGQIVKGNYIVEYGKSEIEIAFKIIGTATEEEWKEFREQQGRPIPMSYLEWRKENKPAYFYKALTD